MFKLSATCQFKENTITTAHCHKVVHMPPISIYSAHTAREGMLNNVFGRYTEEHLVCRKAVS